MTIYLLTAGQDSDSRVLGAFMDQAIAARVQAAYNAGESREGDALIETFESDVLAGAAWRTEWYATIRADGEIVRHAPGPVFTTPRPAVTLWYTLDPARPNPVLATLRSVVSQDHADQLAAEARQRWLRERADP